MNRSEVQVMGVGCAELQWLLHSLHSLFHFLSFICSTEKRKMVPEWKKGEIGGYFTSFQLIVRCNGMRTEHVLQASRT